ncbi:MAG: T9SS type A sorting domain-containing protein, partial [Bacteroidetes bacterium]|nr:T9SS type A sorting domain-containing protein [Bacteroidota bacterium]
QQASQTFVDNYLVPFVNRYKSNPYLFAIDVCNEIEWINQNSVNGQLSLSNLQRFVGMCAAAVHKNSNVPVTVGSACIKWNSDISGMDGNWWKASALQTAFNDPKAYLDFYCVHYYGWMHQWFQSPFEKSPSDYGINDRPVIIQESPAKDAGLSDIPMTVVQCYESAFSKGYQGVFPWTSNGVDTNGDITTVGPATISFKNNHTTLIYPPACPTGIYEQYAESSIRIFPNPASNVTTISYFLTENREVSIIVYNLLGNEIINLNEITQLEGIQQLDINTEDLQNGLYFIKVIIAGQEIIQKLIVTK